MANTINKVHITPGIYASEIVENKKEIKSDTGITKLGLVGETLKGPAFQPYWVHSQGEFTSIFGGTSTEKFKGSGYPKYELPYIAEEFLKTGRELCVVKTLGLSGYNAGPAWVITGSKPGNDNRYVIAVLRSRGNYSFRPELYLQVDQNGCECTRGNDVLIFDVGEKNSVSSCDDDISYNMYAVAIDYYSSVNTTGGDCLPYYFDFQDGQNPDVNRDGTVDTSDISFVTQIKNDNSKYNILADVNRSGDVDQEDYNIVNSAKRTSVPANTLNVSYGNLGRFTIKCIVGPSSPNSVNTSNIVSIPVSLNKSDKDYILNVLGTSNDDGDTPLYVETLYDIAWKDMVLNHGFSRINTQVETYNVGYISDYGGLAPVDGILVTPEQELKRKDLGKRFLYTQNNGSPNNLTYHSFNYKTQKPIGVSACSEGYIYTVVSIFESGQTKYVYRSYTNESTEDLTGDERIAARDRLVDVTSTQGKLSNVVFNNEDNIYYKQNTEIGQMIELEFNKIGTNVDKYLSGSKKINSSNISIIKKVDIKKYPPNNIANISAVTISSSNISVNSLELWEVGISADTDSISSTTRVDINEEDHTWTVQAHKTYQFVSSQAEENSVFSVGIKAYEANDPDENGQHAKTKLTGGVSKIICDLNNYKTPYRYSSTPWTVSNLRGSTGSIEMNRLFRFHTISDGAASLSEVKISIENIRPDSGEFDVIVRDYNDTDSSPVVFESFRKCTMKPGKDFIGYKIGTIDGLYESNSKYITVEVMEGKSVENSVPAGFLGYPIPKYDGEQIDGTQNTNVCVMPISYNTEYDEYRQKRQQYFGLSDIAGYDIDYFTYKGNMATVDEPGFVTHGFHLDSRLDIDSYGADKPVVTVDGINGYEFDTVSPNEVLQGMFTIPTISSEENMKDSIYEDVKLRKFTMMFYGGFDGWDVYRKQRSNTNRFAYSTYGGYMNYKTGTGKNFDILYDSYYNIDGGAITSDYYATLAGVSLLKNPEEVDINLLATPGIDTINNSRLINDIITILEDRADTFYVVTTPDTPGGVGSSINDISDIQEIVDDFSDSELFTTYASTYFPWVKIEDNNEYIWLPPTRDIVRNIAESDSNNPSTNLAPAGKTRGRIDAITVRKKLTTEESDLLYSSNINPILTIQNDGLFVMGQKTMSQEDNLLSRIDVRRMMIRLRRLISNACIDLIFEPYDDDTVQIFKNTISGIIQPFVSNRAIEKWKMETNDSQDMRDKLELGAVIYIKPIRALEYITLSFTVTNNDVIFES